MLIALVGLGVWLLLLTIVFFGFYHFFKKLVKDTGEGELLKVLAKICKLHKENSQAASLANKEIKRLEIQGQSHVQKIGVVKFNPFRETGGDHSFSLAILNGEDTGVIVTCLHTRERTRVYIKPVENGRAELELSAEERKALEKAQ